MKRFLGKILVLVLLTIGLTMIVTGCFTNNEKSEDKSNKQDMKIIVDAAGNKVHVSDDIKKIGVVPIPWASVVYAIDGTSERLTAINPSAIKAYEGSLLEKLDSNFANISTEYIGADFSINKEELLNIGIDTMFIWDYQTDEAEQLKALGIAPVMLKNKTIEELQNSLKVVGELLGREEKAQEFIDAYTKSYEYLVSKSDEINNADKPRVLFLRTSELKVQGNDNFMKEILSISGANNIAANIKESITMEEILKEDPEIIFLSNFDDFTPEDLYENKIDGQDWSNVSAVKNKRVYKTPIGIYRYDAPGIETPLMMLWMAKTIQPEIFDDYEFQDIFNSFYKEYFDYTLTKDDFSLIMNEIANSESLIK